MKKLLTLIFIIFSFLNLSAQALENHKEGDILISKQVGVEYDRILISKKDLEVFGKLKNVEIRVFNEFFIAFNYPPYKPEFRFLKLKFPRNQ